MNPFRSMRPFTRPRPFTRLTPLMSPTGLPRGSTTRVSRGGGGGPASRSSSMIASSSGTSPSGPSPGGGTTSAPQLGHRGAVWGTGSPQEGQGASSSSMRASKAACSNSFGAAGSGWAMTAR